MNKKFTTTTAAIIIAGSIVGVSSTALAGAQTVSTTHRAKLSRHERHEKLETSLNQAVRDGTITEDQRQAFLAELKALRTERKQDLGTKPTESARKTEREKLATELQSWATAHNFPLAKVAPRFVK